MLKLDQIDVANSFLRLPMARNGSKWLLRDQLRPEENQSKTSLYKPEIYGSAFGLQGTPGLAPRVKKNRKKSNILGWIWDGLGVILGRFGGIFGAISDRL